MGYRVDILSTYDDLSKVREFAAGVEVVTVVSGDVPVIALQAAAGSATLYPPVKTFLAVEDGIGTKRDAEKIPLVDFCIIGARGADGACGFYDPIAIDRVDGLVDVARTPAPIGSRLAKKARGMTRDILEDLDVTGVACVEFSLTQEMELVVHDVTPHPHVSGYLTADACVTSQFEQQLRAVCGLALGSTKLLRPAAMAVWQGGPNASAFPSVKLYRGYLTATAASATIAKQIVLTARK